MRAAVRDAVITKYLIRLSLHITARHNETSVATPCGLPLKSEVIQGVFDYQIRIKIHNEFEPRVNPTHI